MSEIEKFTQDMQATFAKLGEQMSASMSAWREASGIPEWHDPGYLGNRCGWYPAKPKRRRKGRP